MKPSFTKTVKSKTRQVQWKQCLFSSKCYEKYLICKRKVNSIEKPSQ